MCPLTRLGSDYITGQSQQPCFVMIKQDYDGGGPDGSVLGGSPELAWAREGQESSGRLGAGMSVLLNDPQVPPEKGLPHAGPFQPERSHW